MCEFDPSQRWTLIYRGSRDGFEAKNFHEKCDSKSPTLTIIRSDCGNIFGGYTEAKWNQANIWQSDRNAFIFSLINKDKKPIRMNIIPEKVKQAIASSPTTGPIFGGVGTKLDLYVTSNGNKAYQSSYLGHSFKHPVYDVDSIEAGSFLAGKSAYLVNEIEVYQKV